MYTYIDACTYVHIYAYAITCTYIYVYTYIDASLYIYIYKRSPNSDVCSNIAHYKSYSKVRSRPEM